MCTAANNCAQLLHWPTNTTVASESDTIKTYDVMGLAKQTDTNGSCAVTVFDTRMTIEKDGNCADLKVSADGTQGPGSLDLLDLVGQTASDVSCASL